MMKANIWVLGFATAGLLSACTNRHHEHYLQGLGHIMAQTAMRHTKLWFAGQAQNWDLAAYEVDELREGFEDAAKYHPTHKQIVKPIPDWIAQTMDRPLDGIDRAVQQKNRQAFIEHYDDLTAACNACHQGTDFAFNVVTRPAFNPYPNQAFSK